MKPSFSLLRLMPPLLLTKLAVCRCGLLCFIQIILWTVEVTSLWSELELAKTEQKENRRHLKRKYHAVYRRGDRRRNCLSDRRADGCAVATVAATGCADDRRIHWRTNVGATVGAKNCNRGYMSIISKHRPLMTTYYDVIAPLLLVNMEVNEQMETTRD